MVNVKVLKKNKKHTCVHRSHKLKIYWEYEQCLGVKLVYVPKIDMNEFFKA